MNTLLLSRHTIWVAAVAVLGVAWAAARSIQPQEPQEFDNGRCIALWSELNEMTPPIENEAGQFRRHVDQMQAWYDKIITMGPVPEREKWVSFYEDEQSLARDKKAKLDADIRDLKIIIKEASSFLSVNKNNWRLPWFVELNTATLNAELAVNHALKIPGPPPLPDPLPSEAAPALEIVKWGYEKKLVLGGGNTYTAEVRCNHEFTSAKGKIEARVRAGPARLDDPAIKEVEVGPHKSIIVKWRFTVTDATDVKIGARVVN